MSDEPINEYGIPLDKWGLPKTVDLMVLDLTKKLSYDQKMDLALRLFSAADYSTAHYLFANLKIRFGATICDGEHNFIHVMEHACVYAQKFSDRERSYENFLDEMCQLMGDVSQQHKSGSLTVEQASILENKIKEACR